MKVTINGNKATIELDLNEKPEPSSSGKTLIVGSTGGFTKTTATVDDKVVSANITLTIKP